jgi:DNA-binding MarR family transcriptional regulator
MSARTTTPDALADALMHAMPQLGHAMGRTLREHPDTGLSLPQLHTLKMLTGGPRSFKDMCSHRRVSGATMSRSIESLVRRGLVERTPHPEDRRQVLLKLSPSGETQLRGLHAHTRNALSTAFSALTGPQRRHIADALALLTQTLAKPESSS